MEESEAPTKRLQFSSQISARVATTQLIQNLKVRDLVEVRLYSVH